MKILYIYDKMPSLYQKYLLNLLDFIKEKLDIKVLVFDDKCNADHCVKRYGFRDYFQYLLFKLRISPYKSLDLKYMFKYDIIHLQHSFLWRKFHPFSKFKKHPKIVITLRGGDTYIKPWINYSWRHFYKNCEHVAAFVTMSEHQKDYLTQWGVSKEKIHVIPISFGSRSVAIPKYPNVNAIKLVSAFRMTWEKNIEGTLRFACILKDKNIPFQYDIYGDGNDMGQLYYFIDRFNLHGFVCVKGKIDNDELKVKLVDYDFFVQLSFSEALPTSVLEAQSVGLPCIVSNSGGLPEAVKRDETALVGDFHELDALVRAMVNLWKNKELYYSYSERAIQNANEKFTIDKEIERLRELYDTLMK